MKTKCLAIEYLFFVYIVIANELKRFLEFLTLFFLKEKNVKVVVLYDHDIYITKQACLRLVGRYRNVCRTNFIIINILTLFSVAVYC